MTETTQSAAQSVQVAKLPFFYEHNSDGLFTHIEAQFEIAGISNEETNFYHAVTALILQQVERFSTSYKLNAPATMERFIAT